MKDPPVIAPKVWIVSLLLFSKLACSPSSSTHNEPVPLPADLQIVLGEGGGFSGLWSGYSIHAGDTVFEWKGRSFGENPVFAGTLPHDSISVLWQQAYELRLLDRPSKVVHANYVQALKISADGSEHMFTWEPMNSADSTTASAVAFRARCLGTIRNSLHP